MPAAVGYFDLSGNLDTAITIRTILMKDGVAHVQSGGGIVYDSDAATEYAETENKARGADPRNRAGRSAVCGQTRWQPGVLGTAWVPGETQMGSMQIAREGNVAGTAQAGVEEYR